MVFLGPGLLPAHWPASPKKGALVVVKKSAVPVGEVIEGEGLREIVNPAWIRDRYQVSEQFIARRIADGGLKPFKVGAKANRFYLDEVIAFMEPNQQKRKVS